ncbi:MAG: HAD hydrolase-like protein, partial [Acidobacteriota bacterium]|nr:HAD hydrolase-like protein [Acidobacteriota bacterium]
MHLFFDLDGTLTDSCEGITRCINHALLAAGRPEEPDDRLRGMIGQSLTRIFGALMDRPDDAAVDRAIAAYRVRFDEIGIFENRVYPGIVDALASLQSAGHRMRVVTAKPAPAATRVIAHFDLARLFDGIHGPALTDRGCDKADLLGAALEAAGAQPARALMIGDRVDDMLAARAHR